MNPINTSPPVSPNTTDRPELFIGLVGPTGIRLDDLTNELKKELDILGYDAIDIRLSDLLANFSWVTQQEGYTEFDRVSHLQKKGDAFRECLKDGAALARAALVEIRNKRRSISGSSDRPAWSHAYLLRQLKHPDEVDMLREVYGSSFVLVAGHAPRDVLVKELTKQMARKESRIGQESLFLGKANELIEADQKQDGDFGQNTRDTYPKADFFVNMGIGGGEYQVARFMDLLFGHPLYTPKPDEYAMYQASAASLRSSDDNRQVGAVIVSQTSVNGRVKSADVIATGMNEVPRGGGGFYWDQDSPDLRDQALLQQGEDRAKEIKIGVLAELIERIQGEGWFQEEHKKKLPRDLALALLPTLRGTQFLRIGEFSRPVHAEMAALIDSARRGVAVNGHTMYVTTFPCHNCAKHIVAAGIRKVVYLEPYPKSRAQILHGDEMVLESLDGMESEGKVVFFAFSGVAPRQYRQLFSMSLRGAKKGLSLKEWEKNKRTLSPRYVKRNAEQSYLAAESQELDKLPIDVYSWDKNVVCPMEKLNRRVSDAEHGESPKT